MALPNTHSYSAKQLQAQMLSGKFDKLRWFQFEGMSGGKIGQGGSYSPIWTRQTGASTYHPPGNGTNPHTWFNASYAAAFPPQCPHGGDPATCQHVDTGPFFKFSATCTEFGRNLLEMLGEKAPPIGLIQSAVSGANCRLLSIRTSVLKAVYTSRLANAMLYGNGVSSRFADRWDTNRSLESKCHYLDLSEQNCRRTNSRPSKWPPVLRHGVPLCQYEHSRICLVSRYYYPTIQRRQ